MEKQKLVTARRILFALTLAGMIAIPTATLRAQSSDQTTATQGGILDVLEHMRQAQAQRLWWYLLVAGGLLLAGETLLANRLSTNASRLL